LLLGRSGVKVESIQGSGLDVSQWVITPLAANIPKLPVLVKRPQKLRAK
jgi:hypothetical protein